MMKDPICTPVPRKNLTLYLIKFLTLAVLTEVYPQRQRELDAYERCIIDMGIRYPG